MWTPAWSAEPSLIVLTCLSPEPGIPIHPVLRPDPWTLYQIPRRPAEGPKPAFDAVSRTPMPSRMLFRSRMLMAARPSAPHQRLTPLTAPDPESRLHHASRHCQGSPTKRFAEVRAHGVNTSERRDSLGTVVTIRSQAPAVHHPRTGLPALSGRGRSRSLARPRTFAHGRVFGPERGGRFLGERLSRVGAERFIER